MPDPTIEVVKIGGGFFVGVIAAILGIRKMVAAEVGAGMSPCVAGMKKDISDLREDSKSHMPEAQHKLICNLTTANVNQKFAAQRDHMDTLFKELNARLDQRRATNGE